MLHVKSRRELQNKNSKQETRRYFFFLERLGGCTGEGFSFRFQSPGPVCLELVGEARETRVKTPIQRLTAARLLNAAAAAASLGRCERAASKQALQTELRRHRETYHFSQSPGRPARIVPVWSYSTQTILQELYVRRQMTPLAPPLTAAGGGAAQRLSTKKLIPALCLCELRAGCCCCCCFLYFQQHFAEDAKRYALSAVARM